jgi:hypothetical protein
VDIVVIILLLGALVLLGLSTSRSADQARTAARLTAIERRLSLIMEHLGVADPQPHLAPVRAELARGRKIEAIKAYREITGAGLREAKEAVDGLARGSGG